MIIYSCKREFSKENLNMKREALRETLKSQKIILRKISDGNDDVKRNIRIPVFTPIFFYKSERI